jgi:predicted helicase
MWLVRGEPRMTISLGQVQGKTIAAAKDAQARWDELIKSFLGEIALTVDKPQALAQMLAGQTRLLRDLVAELVSVGNADLQDQLHTFKTLLLPDLAAQEFADMYAQTAAYGLFTARVFDHTTLFGGNAEPLPESQKNKAFSLEKSPYLIPRANPFLRQFFQHIASPDLDQQLRWLVEQIAASLCFVDMDKVLHVQGRKQGFEDPVFHFYESFLAEYDRALRESRGVYYTPEPVVDFIVRGVDWLLKEKLGKPDGLADKDALILDPAAGTATFLRRVVECIHQRVIKQGNAGLWPQYVRERLLPRLFGFELMMAPYTVAHLKLALQLQEQGFVFGKDRAGKDERLNVFLTNTLDTISGQVDAYLSKWISDESAGAERVKRNQPVQVVLGNPPYSGESQNKSAQILTLLTEYKKEPAGGPLQERNSKWINDDYVKFIRFAHDRINRTGHGVVAFITNHSWLDNPTFRGMRASLMRDFDDIYVLDLHGNAKKKERTPPALQVQGDDKNVFDIEQGVAIVFLLKQDSSATFELSASSADLPPRKAHIHHAELWGSRDCKYNWLHQHSLADTPWQTLQPALPLLLLAPRNEHATLEYERGWKVTDILPVHGTGIVTKCDELNIHFTSNDCWEVVTWFKASNEADARRRFRLPAEHVRDWSFARAMQDVVDSGPSKERIFPISYRPFDVRYTYYTGRSRGVMGWPVEKIMAHLVNLAHNIYLGVCRQMNGDQWTHTFVGQTLAESCFISNKTSEIGSAFPLWLIQAQGDPRPNLAPQFLEQLAASLGLQTQPQRHDLPQGVQPEDVLAYIYAVLHAPSYRARYAEYLKSDFPRIPIAVCAGSRDTFAQVWQALLPLGRALLDLHLLKQVPGHLQARYPQSGDNQVEKPRFEQKAHVGRVWINASQYFEAVPEETWAFKIGGYQVCEKWLKDRKGRVLSLDDIEHYCRTVAALTQTRALMQVIDSVANGQLWPLAVDIS